MNNNFNAELGQLFERYKRTPKHSAEAHNLLIDLVELIDAELLTRNLTDESHKKSRPITDGSSCLRDKLQRGDY